MWDSMRLSLTGNFSMRKMILVFVAGLMSALFVSLANSTTTFAEAATWEGDSIKIGNETYEKVSETTVIPGIGADRSAYKSTQPKDGVITVLSLPRDPDKSREITDIRQYEYNFDEQTGTYSNQQRPPNNAVLVTSINAQAGDPAAEAERTSCGVKGIGWIICSVSRFMADAMDKIYEWIKSFLVVKPLTTDTESGLFQAWKIALGLANACFIIAFLVIIYSQITNQGINNYEIKKMIPRLIIAAILVNASYYVCTIAIDVSNIMGNSIQQALADIRESLPAPKAQTSWANLTTFILSGGTLAAIGGYAASAIAGGPLALVYLLVPALVGGVLSVLVAVIVLAARQALITVLVVLAPIAFVAYLLPNTEKHFERWRGLFVNMLMIFPLFSLLFGGSQLASYLIIQNTDQISVVILAMFVQVAPLMITPFLMKVSHNLLTQLGGFVDNPRKGLVDRSRNWSSERAALRKAEHQEKGANRPWYTPTGISYRNAKGRKFREKRLSNAQEGFDAAIANEERMQLLMGDSKRAGLRKDRGEARADAMFERDKSKSAAMRRDVGDTRLAKMEAEVYHEREEARWNEALAKSTLDNSNHVFYKYAKQAQKLELEKHIAEGNKHAAEAVQKKDYVEELKESPGLQMRVGGIDPNGATKAYATAKAADVAGKAELVKQIEDSSSILPGQIHQMDASLRDAINEGNIEAARAYINMLAKSNDPGVHRLRMTLRKFEAKMESNGMIGDIKFHIDSHASLNNDAEDIVKWSRVNDKSLKEVAQIDETWSNQTANKIIGQKMTSQLIALKSGGISEGTMREILLNPAKVGLKPVVIKEIRRQMKLNEDGSEDEWLRDMTAERQAKLDSRPAPGPQALPDPDRQEDYEQAIQIR